MFPIILKVGPLTLHTYGLLVALGFLAGYRVARKNFREAGLPASVLDNLMLGIMISGIVGARLFYFLLEGDMSFWSDPLSFVRIWEGGLVYYGAFLFGFAYLATALHLKRISFLTALDALMAPTLLAHAIGRLGCFAAGCCYGKETFSWIGVTFTHPESLAPLFRPLHPAQLYESAGNFILFLGALALQKKKPAKGMMLLFYLIGYGAFRFLMENVRDDFRGTFMSGLSPSQWISVSTLIAGLGVFFYDKNKSRS